MANSSKFLPDYSRVPRQFIVDGHQHFWEIGRFEYPWMTPERRVLRRNFLPEDLKPLLVKAGVDRTILVQAHPSLAESQWLLGLAQENEFVAGVVAWVDMKSPTLPRDLDKLQLHSKFKGIRHPIEAEPDDSWMICKDVWAGFSELERRGIPYDLVVFPRHLKYIPRLRDSFPKLNLIIDHIAKPSISEKKFDQWAMDLATVARGSNIWCKLSGMITEANHKSWTAEDLIPYVRHVVEQFGYNRLMFGSDWPVCLLAGSYQQVMDTLRKVLGPLQKEDAAKLWGQNACKFYQIGPTEISSKKAEEPVKTFGLTLSLRDDPNTIAAYKEYHRHVWPEVEASLRGVGIKRINIFLLGRRLFMFMEVTEDFNPSTYVDRYLEEPKAVEWENLMKPLQEAVSEAKPGEWWARMELIYELDA